MDYITMSHKEIKRYDIIKKLINQELNGSEAAGLLELSVRHIHRAWRQHKASFGEMIQFDGSYEHWLKDRNETSEMCLLAAIDDATSIVTKAKFDTDEGVLPVFGFWQEYLIANGKPYSVYVDKFSTYKMNQRTAIENHDTLIQFERAMSELNMEPITAHSS